MTVSTYLLKTRMTTKNDEQ